jgi:hypothetical protein
MSQDDPAFLQTLAMVFAGGGLAELALGAWYSRAATPDQSRPFGYFLVRSGTGFLAGSLPLFWGWDYMQSLIAAIVAVAIGGNLGAFRMMRAMKAVREGQIP